MDEETDAMAGAASKEVACEMQANELSCLREALRDPKPPKAPDVPHLSLVVEMPGQLAQEEMPGLLLEEEGDKKSLHVMPEDLGAFVSEQNREGGQQQAAEAASSSPQSVISIKELFAQHHAELRMNPQDAKKKSSLLASEELLWTTEDLYLLGSQEGFFQLPLPLHMRRWLFEERNALLYDPVGRVARMPVKQEVKRRANSIEANAKCQLSITKSSQAMPVEVTVQLNSISKLDIKEMTFDVDFTLMLDWTDHTVVGLSVDEVMQLQDLFNPEVVVENAVGDDQPIAGSSPRPRIHRVEHGKCVDGHLKKTSRYRMPLMCSELDLRFFPYDSQILPIRLKAVNHMGPQERKGAANCGIALVGPDGPAGMNSMDGLRAIGHSIDRRADHLSEWKIHSLMGIRSGDADRFYEVEIIVWRDPGHVMWNVFFPSMMILLFAFTSYAIPIAELNGRLEITATCLLSMMAFQGTIKDMLPPMPYLTALGKYVIVVFVVVVFHGFEHALLFILTSDADSNDWRNRPPDLLFGSVDYWNETSKSVVQGEAVIIIVEFFLLAVAHAAFIWVNLRRRHQGDLQRQHDAKRSGVTLVLGPPPWGAGHRQKRMTSSRSVKLDESRMLELSTRSR